MPLPYRCGNALPPKGGRPMMPAGVSLGFSIAYHFVELEVTMTSPSVYCFCTSELQANAILVHLRNDGFGHELSVFLQDRSDTKDISLRENAIRGAGIGSLVGAFVSLAVPGLGSVLAIGPLLGLINGAAAGGAVGGLLGGTGALKPPGLPEEISELLNHHLKEGKILIAVHSDDPDKLEKALEIFKSEDAMDVYDSRVIPGGPGNGNDSVQKYPVERRPR